MSFWFITSSMAKNVEHFIMYLLAICPYFCFWDVLAQFICPFMDWIILLVFNFWVLCIFWMWIPCQMSSWQKFSSYSLSSLW
jgi:hypothetical protein